MFVTFMTMHKYISINHVFMLIIIHIIIIEHKKQSIIPSLKLSCDVISLEFE